jgi:hypothetical protein
MATSASDPEWNKIDQAFRVLPKALAVFPVIADRVLPQEPKAREKLILIVLALREAYEPAAALAAEVEGLTVATPDERIRTERVLRPQEFDPLMNEVFDARGACGLIGRTYARNLRRPCARWLSKKDAETVESVFHELGEYDSEFVDGMEQLANTVQAGASAVLLSLENDDVESAERRLGDLRTEVRPRRQQLALSLRQLREVEHGFGSRQATWNPVARLWRRLRRRVHNDVAAPG